MKDWRLVQLEDKEYLYGIRLQHAAYRQYRPSWDHDHCVGCNDTFSEKEETSLHEGYTTCSDFEYGPEYWWVCPECFQLFKSAMKWSEVANTP
jgi:hypothetical protein